MNPFLTTDLCLGTGSNMYTTEIKATNNNSNNNNTHNYLLVSYSVPSVNCPVTNLAILFTQLNYVLSKNL